MTKSASLRIIATGLALSLTMFLSGPTSAVTLRTILVPVHQIGTGAQIALGHTVDAKTDYNRLTAGGTYSAQCAAAETLATSGQRTLSSNGITGPRSLIVTIPAVHPARVNMPGFNATTLRGRRLDCTYVWTSRAVEGQYTVGAGGGGVVVGGGDHSDGGTELFMMTVPSLGDVNEGSPCIP